MRSHLVFSAILGQAAALAVFAIAGCGDDSADTTGGRRVVLHTRVELAKGESEGFVTPVGWNVELTRVLLSTGAFRYFDGVPPLATLEMPGELDWAGRFLGLRIARAHPGHYVTGNALGEMLEPYSADLLAGPTEYPEGAGVTGRYRSARFSFSTPPAGPLASALGGHAAIVEGTATLDTQETRHFRAVAELEDVELSAAGGAVDGCVLDEVTVDADGTITVTVRPSVWFKLVDFSLLEPGAEGAPTTFAPGTQPQIAFSQGLGELSAYHFAYSE